ncbi:F-box/kelch-repeat protein At3g23880-like [Silene latifolia]|uniref:F-box/kelch-repeat protein At3g23880-like n=1 Tax=Silene latifolia TaxID=37657 RepID=UPI003D77EA8E
MTSFHHQLKIMSVMKKAKLGNENASEIPEHLILEHILPRLPVKSLLRFKTVSKTWLSSISAPAFQKSHLRLSSYAPKFLLSHVDDDDRKIFLLSYDESKTILSDLVHLNSNILSEQSDHFYPIGSCNGLLCWYHEPLDSFTIWNPATRHCKKILGYSETTDQVTFHEVFDAYGFGYVSSTHDYKILVMYLSSHIQGFGYFYLYSLNTGTWSTLNYLDGMYYARSLCSITAVYMDDTLYWPFRNQTTGALVGIIGFDLVTDQMNPVQQIPWLCNYMSVDQIFKMEGCLSLCCSKGRNLDSDIWMLKQQGDPKTWSKLFSIDCKMTPVLDFTENGKYLVQHSGQLKLIDPVEEDAHHSTNGIDCHDEILGTGSKYVESLISF